MLKPVHGGEGLRANNRRNVRRMIVRRMIFLSSDERESEC
jgi:hypothetical protein